MDFKKSFCFRSNLSNDDMISGLKSENGKMTILVWNRVRIWRIGRHTPTKNSQDYPPPPPGFGSGEAFFTAWVVVKNISADSNAGIQPILLGQTPHFAWNELNNSSTLVKYGVGQIWF